MLPVHSQAKAPADYRGLFVPSERTEDVSATDISGETEILGETENHAYVSAVSLVSVSEGIGATGKDDSEDF